MEPQTNQNGPRKLSYNDRMKALAAIQAEKARMRIVREAMSHLAYREDD